MWLLFYQKWQCSVSVAGLTVETNYMYSILCFNVVQKFQIKSLCTGVNNTPEGKIICLLYW